jgi:hypothetical protein
VAEEGYILVASGDQKYYKFAAQAARTIKYFDTQRAICLACDDKNAVAKTDLGLFDAFAVLRNTEKLRGTEHHLYMYDLSPFERTMYIDSDCLVASARIHDIWSKLRSSHVSFQGNRRVEGEWRRLDIAAIRRKFNLDYVLQLNGGVFYFDRSTEAQNFFGLAQSLFDARHPEITQTHVHGGGRSNEPIWAVAMALSRFAEMPLSSLWQLSTTRLERWSIDSAPSITMLKDGRLQTPIICHFLGLGGPKCPNDLYKAFCKVIDVRQNRPTMKLEQDVSHRER